MADFAENNPDGIFRPADLAGKDPAREIGEPGQYPYTRGPHATMYRGRMWTMRQYAGYAGAAESNRRYRYLLEQGATGLSVAFDLPTQIGLDSDDPMARGEVGRVGVAIGSLGDMDLLTAGLPLERISVSMTINATAAILLAMYVAAARRRGMDARRLSGTVQNDILKEYIARGTYIYPLAPAMRLVTDIFEYAARELPAWNTISISGYHMREAGCTAAQEIAFTLANGITYVAAAVERGLEVDAFAPRLSFFFNAHNGLIVEVAKFRAARRMWARRMREQFGARNPRSWALRFHAQTGGSTLAAQQPRVNLMRTAYQALAAVLGGAQSLHANSYDEALGLPTEEAARLAVRTQQVLAHEAGVAEIVDALGGSYAVEAITDRLEREAEEYIGRIEGMGGMARAIESGYVQREIQNAAYEYQRCVESGEQVVVGVNRFTEGEGGGAAAAAGLRIDPEAEGRQIARLRQWRATRDAQRWGAALARLEAAAEGQENLMPPILEAVEAGATTGEIAAAMRRIFGEYHEGVTV